MAGFDVRQKGSGNAGTTNVLRSVGKKAAIFTLILDVLKGVVAILVAYIAGKIVKDIDKSLLIQIAGIALKIKMAEFMQRAQRIESTSIEFEKSTMIKSLIEDILQYGRLEGLGRET